MTLVFRIETAWPKHLNMVRDDLMEKLGEEILEDAKRYCPVNTGRLRASLFAEVEDGELRVGSRDVKYAQMVEFGTRPHVIKPRNKQALSWPGAAHPVAQVNHPGTQAQPFLRPALHKPRVII